MLIFPLTREWYEKIKSGEKTVEYREVKAYWCKRFCKELRPLYFKPYNDGNIPKNLVGVSELYDDKLVVCKLRLGYTNRYMTARITKIEVVNGKDTDLHIDKPVYAIYLTDVREVEE